MGDEESACRWGSGGEEDAQDDDDASDSTIRASDYVLEREVATKTSATSLSLFLLFVIRTLKASITLIYMSNLIE